MCGQAHAEPGGRFCTAGHGNLAPGITNRTVQVSGARHSAKREQGRAGGLGIGGSITAKSTVPAVIPSSIRALVRKKVMLSFSHTLR